MTWYPDLGQGCMVGAGGDVRAIGWLSSNQPFSTGALPAEFAAALARQLAAAWQPVQMMGFHICELAGCSAAQGDLASCFDSVTDERTCSA